MTSELSNLSISIAIVVAAVIVSWLSGFALRIITHRVLRKTQTELDDVVVNAIRGPLRVAIVIVGVQIALRQLELIEDAWRSNISDVFFVVYLVLVYVAIYQLISGFSKWYKKDVAAKTETDLDDKFLDFLRALAIMLVTVIAFITLLGRFGIELSALVTTLGIGTLAVALAAQETLSDIIAGFMIMLDRPFSIGDRVAITDIDTWGDITEIGLRSTRILTRDNRMVTVPNSVIGKGLVVNYSDPSTVYRVQTHVGVEYGADLEEARKVMIEAILAEDWVMKERPVEALMLEFGDSALVFRVRCWIEHYIETRRVIDKMNTALYHALDKAGIIIPLPQQEIHLHPASVTPEQELKPDSEGP
jgi:small-conductance mechanosensitive channel